MARRRASTKTFGLQRGGGGVDRVGQQQGELVSAETRDQPRLGQHGVDALGYGAQQDVALVVPERVVDGLEVVDVHERDCETPARAAAGRDRLDECLAKAHPVRQAGERVVQGAMAHLLARLVQLIALAGQGFGQPLEMRGIRDYDLLDEMFERQPGGQCHRRPGQRMMGALLAPDLEIPGRPAERTLAITVGERQRGRIATPIDRVLDPLTSEDQDVLAPFVDEDDQDAGEPIRIGRRRLELTGETVGVPDRTGTGAQKGHQLLDPLGREVAVLTEEQRLSTAVDLHHVGVDQLAQLMLLADEALGKGLLDVDLADDGVHPRHAELGGQGALAFLDQGHPSRQTAGQLDEPAPDIGRQRMGRAMMEDHQSPEPVVLHDRQRHRAIDAEALEIVAMDGRLGAQMGDADVEAVRCQRAAQERHVGMIAARSVAHGGFAIECAGLTRDVGGRIAQPQDRGPGIGLLALGDHHARIVGVEPIDHHPLEAGQMTKGRHSLATDRIDRVARAQPALEGLDIEAAQTRVQLHLAMRLDLQQQTLPPAMQAQVERQLTERRLDLEEGWMKGRRLGAGVQGRLQLSRLGRCKDARQRCIEQRLGLQAQIHSGIGTTGLDAACFGIEHQQTAEGLDSTTGTDGFAVAL
jgi:hypothetical protein